MSESAKPHDVWRDEFTKATGWAVPAFNVAQIREFNARVMGFRETRKVGTDEMRECVRRVFRENPLGVPVADYGKLDVLVRGLYHVTSDSKNRARANKDDGGLGGAYRRG